VFLPDLLDCVNRRLASTLFDHLLEFAIALEQLVLEVLTLDAYDVGGGLPMLKDQNIFLLGTGHISA